MADPDRDHTVQTAGAVDGQVQPRSVRALDPHLSEPRRLVGRDRRGTAFGADEDLTERLRQACVRLPTPIPPSVDPSGMTAPIDAVLEPCVNGRVGVAGSVEKFEHVPKFTQDVSPRDHSRVILPKLATDSITDHKHYPPYYPYRPTFNASLSTSGKTGMSAPGPV
jgi:hypothetical protein